VCPGVLSPTVSPLRAPPRSPPRLPALGLALATPCVSGAPTAHPSRCPLPKGRQALCGPGVPGLNAPGCVDPRAPWVPCFASRWPSHYPPLLPIPTAPFPRSLRGVIQAPPCPALQGPGPVLGRAVLAQRLSPLVWEPLRTALGELRACPGRGAAPGVPGLEPGVQGLEPGVLRQMPAESSSPLPAPLTSALSPLAMAPQKAVRSRVPQTVLAPARPGQAWSWGMALALGSPRQQRPPRKTPCLHGFPAPWKSPCSSLSCPAACTSYYRLPLLTELPAPAGVALVVPSAPLPGRREEAAPWRYLLCPIAATTRPAAARQRGRQCGRGAVLYQKHRCLSRGQTQGHRGRPWARGCGCGSRGEERSEGRRRGRWGADVGLGARTHGGPWCMAAGARAVQEGQARVHRARTREGALWLVQRTDPVALAPPLSRTPAPLPALSSLTHLPALRCSRSLQRPYVGAGGGWS